MQPVHSAIRRVSHASVDFLGELKVSALLGLFEQAAVEASAAAGWDPARYAAEGRVWIVRRTRLERRVPLAGGDTVRVATRVEDFRRARSIRRYEVERTARLGAGPHPAGAADGGAPPTAAKSPPDARDAPPVAADGPPRTGGAPPAALDAPHAAGDAAERAAGGERSPDHAGGAAAVATTDWVYCDAASGRPVSVPEEMKSALFGGAAPVLARAARVDVRGDGAPCRFLVPVRPSHLDHMGHVNNAVWADFLEDAAFELFAAAGFGLDRMLGAGGALRVRRLDLEYLDEARLGESLCVSSWLEDAPPAADGGVPAAARVLQAIDDAGGRRLVRAASEWVWRLRPTILGGAPTG